MNPEISLITATLGRVNEIRLLLESLVRQSFKDFEIIIIDQNNHFLVKDIVKNFENKLLIKYIHNDVKGLSVNRNKGLQIASGKILGFPDDDCYYSEEILQNVHNIFQKENMKFICFNVFDINNSSFCWKPVTKGYFKRNKIYDNCISFNFFIRRNEVLFDERFGVGAQFGSGEETDYLFENIRRNDIGYGEITGKIFHNYPNNNWNEALIQKNYHYCEGFGALCKKDIFLRKNISTLFLFLKYIIRPFVGLIIKKNKKVYITTLQGRLKGFMEYKG